MDDRNVPRYIFMRKTTIQIQFCNLSVLKCEGVGEKLLSHEKGEDPFSNSLE